MPKKNTHGGQRDNSGRKPDLLKVGKQFLYWLITPNGKRTLLRTITVTRYDRDLGVIELTDDQSGEVVHLDCGKRRSKRK